MLRGKISKDEILNAVNSSSLFCVQPYNARQSQCNGTPTFNHLAISAQVRLCDLRNRSVSVTVSMIMHCYLVLPIGQLLWADMCGREPSKKVL